MLEGSVPGQTIAYDPKEGQPTQPYPRFHLGIENNFKYHAPKEGQPAKYEAIREKAKELAYLIEDLTPNSREKSLALTNLEQSVFWANAGIARNE